MFSNNKTIGWKQNDTFSTFSEKLYHYYFVGLGDAFILRGWSCERVGGDELTENAAVYEKWL